MSFEKVTIGPHTLYRGDCREVLPTLGKKHSIVTDPPFGVGNFVQTSGNVRGKEVTWNDSPPPSDVFQVFREMSKYRVIWGANYFNCFEGAGALVWLKNQPMPNFSQAEIASVSWGNKVGLLSHTWTNYVNTKESDHPCERPVDLYSWCIGLIPERPTEVVDPYMGSASCGVACARLGIPFIGIEINPDYFAIAVKRITEAVNRGALFTGETEPVREEIPPLFTP